MKKIMLVFLIINFSNYLQIIFAQCTSPCNDLTNLATTVAADNTISPGTVNTLDLGASSAQWANLYLGTSQYFTVAPASGGGATISTTSGASGLGAQGVVIVITFL